MQIDSFSKMYSCNLIAETVPVLRKNYYPFPPFPFINTPSQMKIFIYSNYPFSLQSSPCPSTLLFINHIFSWKSKLKHTSAHITCFFSRYKNLHQQNIKSVYWQRLSEPVKNLSWSFLQKKLTTYGQKQFSPKSSSSDV